MTSDRKATRRSRKLRPRTTPMTQGVSAVDQVDRVGVERGHAPDEDLDRGARLDQGDDLLAQVVHGVHRRAAGRFRVDGQLEDREVALGRRLVADDREPVRRPRARSSALSSSAVVRGSLRSPSRVTRIGDPRPAEKSRCRARRTPAWRWCRRGTPAAPPCRSSCRGAGTLKRSSTPHPVTRPISGRRIITRAARVQRPSRSPSSAVRAARAGAGPTPPGRRAAGRRPAGG